MLHAVLHITLQHNYTYIRKLIHKDQKEFIKTTKAIMYKKGREKCVEGEQVGRKGKQTNHN